MRPFISSKSTFCSCLRVGHQRVLIGVLGFQMGADIGIEDGRVLEDLLPVVGAQPCIVVAARDAVAGIVTGRFSAFGGVTDGALERTGMSCFPMHV